MVEKLSVQIALEGGKEVERQLADIGKAGQQAFGEIEKAASQAGGFKNLDPKDVTKKLEDMGLKGTAALEKIQGAVKSAGRYEGIVQGVAAVEAGFMAVARAAGVAGAAVVAAGVALSRYTSEAAKVAEALGPLADLSGEAMKSVSALQIVFAQGGVAAQKFASEFTALEQRVQEASRTMADDVVQSAQRIQQAHQAVAQAALGVESAELNLAKAALAAREARTGIDPIARENLARRQAALRLEQAEQQVAAARLAQQQAAHNARVAEANDLKKIIQLYTQMGRGANVAFDPLTTQATKNSALLATLAQAGSNWKFVLADILKNATELERIQIGKALGLDQKTLDLLKQGSAELQRQQRAVENLGIALTDADRSNLKAFTDSWIALGATASAVLQKIGAMLAPLGTLIATGLTNALLGLVQFIQTTGREFAALGSVIDSVATAGAAAIKFMVDAVTGLATGISILVSAIGSITWGVLQTGVDAWNALAGAIQGAIDKLLTFLGLKDRAGGTPLAGGAPIGGPGGGIGSNAAGGLLGGRGTGTSDSNLAWVSRGEHIMPARAVAQPGVLAFLEALRRSGGNLSRVLDGMGRFALGGMVPRAIPAFATGGLAGGMSNVTIQFPGLPDIGGLRASSSAVGELRKAAALAQVRSGGRKPSRYS